MREIFRPSALARLRAPDQLDTMRSISSPLSWICAAALAIMTTSVLLYALFGSVPETVSSAGLLTGPHGVGTVYSSAAGTLQSILAAPGSSAENGTVLCEVRDVSGNSCVQTMDQPGVIESVLVRPGDEVHVNDELFRISLSSAHPLTAICFLSPEQAVMVEPGMPATFTADLPDSAMYLKGTVAHVDRYAASRQALLDLLGGNELLYNQITADGPVVMTACVPDEDDSGWENLRSGIQVSSRVIVRTRHPLELMLSH